ncbi:MAG: T9SS type A sorting domain-containing protein [Aureispira sp.]|nr:T9SS type A sorting domain-containing protein [Aureispira sp.]
MKKINSLASILLIFCLFSAQRSTATHLDGADIYYECIGFGKYVVTLELYTDCATGVSVIPVKTISSGCNQIGPISNLTLPLVSNTEVSPVCDGTPTLCTGGGLPGTRLLVYQDTVELTEFCNNWRFTFSECCRNDAITNVANVSNEDQYIYTTVNNTQYFCNSSPKFLNSATATANVGQPFVYDPHIHDPDGDSLAISWIPPHGFGMTSLFYFYGVPVASVTPFDLDPQTGILSYTPGQPDVSLITYRIDEYRDGQLIGTSVKDITIYHVNGTIGNIVPTYTLGNTTGGTLATDTFTVCSGNTLTFDIIVTDTNTTDSIDLLGHYITDALPGATITSTGTNSKTYTISWYASDAGTYRVLGILNDVNCPFIQTGQLVDLTVNVLGTNPVLSLSDQYLCSTSPITISAGNGFGNYNWSTGETTSSISVTTEGIYSLTVSSSCGVGMASVEIFDIPEFSVGNDTLINQGDSIALTAILANGLVTDITIRKDTAMLIEAGTMVAMPLYVSAVYPSILEAGVTRRACFDITGANMWQVNAYLVPPNGVLMPLTTGNGGNSSNMQNICFSPDATVPITNYAGASIPADSTYIPEGSWSSIYGSNTNGTWHLAFQRAAFTNPAHVLNYFSLNLGGYEYDWSPSAGLSCTDCSNPIASPDTATTYIVTMTGTNGCVSYDTITITVDLPAIDLVASDTMLCASATGAVTLDAGAGYPSYLWSTGETTQTIAPITAATYSVTVTGTTQDSVASVTIYESYPIMTSNDTTIYAGDSASLVVNMMGGIQATWSPSSSLSCSNCINPTASPSSTTTYTVDVNHPNGCVSLDSVLVTVLPRPNAPTDTIEFVMEEDSIFGMCATLPGFMGTPTSNNVICWSAGFVGIPSFTGTNGCFDYYALAPAQATDTICIEVCDNAGLCDTTVFVITIASCVWAGDTDTNQIANNFDLLPIGLGMGETGAVRPNADLNFDCEPNLDWAGSTPVSNVNYKHSDTDGDGVVTVLDTVAIVQNWGQFYVRGTQSVGGSQTPKPFYVDYEQTVPSATIQVPIILGDTLNPVDSAYGVAFTINYDPQYVDTNSVSVHFDNSWFGTINSDMISISKDFYYQGHIDVGLTRINHLPRDGFGQLGIIQMTIKDDILKSNVRHLNMHISNVRLITDQEVEIPTNNLPTYVLILLPTGVEDIDATTGIKIYPNPAYSTVYMESEEILESAQLFSTTGQLVREYSVSQGINELNVEQLPTGTYILSVQNTKGRYQQRITIIR